MAAIQGRRESLNFVMFLLWIVENMILSFLESKILLWKVNFHIYFPQWQVTSKVSVEPCFTHLKKEVVRNPNKRQMYLQPPPFDQNIQANQAFQVIPVREDN